MAIFGRTVTAALIAALSGAQITFATETEKQDEPDIRWRVMTAMRPPVFEKDGRIMTLPQLIDSGVEVWRKSPPDQPHTPDPPADWASPDFDDSGPDWDLTGDWLFRHSNRYGNSQACSLAAIYARGRFDVANPPASGQLKLSVEYRGGIRVLLNGKEIARAHLPAGRLDSDTAAEAYPRNAHVGANGKPYSTKRMNRKSQEIFEVRVRRLECELPKSALRPGMNVLAVETHRAPLIEVFAKGGGWATTGIVHLDLAGLPGRSAGKGMRLWNASVMTDLRESDPTPPARPLMPMRIAGTRNGVFSAQVVAECAAGSGIKKASVTAFERAGGGSIPASAARIRYALPRRLGGKIDIRQSWDREFIHSDAFETLSNVPASGLPSGWGDGKPLMRQPVWVTVKIPRDAAPGAYRGKLTIEFGSGPAEQVPVEMSVGPFALPDPADYVASIGIIQSPESLALAYDVPPYSEKNWDLIAQSWKWLAEIGNDVVYIPVICKSHIGNGEGMVVWKGGKQPDFSRMERYLDTVLASGAKPKVVCLYVWEYYCSSVVRNQEDLNPSQRKGLQRVIKKPGPPILSSGDPAAGKTTEMTAPAYDDPGAAAFWKPVAEGALACLRKRGLEKTLTLGLQGDMAPRKEGAQKVWSALLPDRGWACHRHPRVMPHEKDIAYASTAYHVMYPLDPAVQSPRGWKPGPVIQVANIVRSWRGANANHAHARMIPTLIMDGGMQGIGRMSGDLWNIVERFMTSDYVQLSLGLGAGRELLRPMPDGPETTVSFEMFREGIEEVEARIAVQKAIDGKRANAKMGAVLDEHLRYMLWTGLHGHGNTWGQNVVWKAGAADSGKVRDKGPRNHEGAIWGGMGMDWYVGSGWQKRAALLFEAAGAAGPR